jgi:mannosyltransferase
MLAGLILRDLFRKRLKLLFTSASQRQHTGWSRALIRRMDAVVSTSEKTARYLERPSQVIHHGIDLDTFSPAHDRAAIRARLGLPSDGRLVGCYGRIRAQKGTDLFVQAAIGLCRAFPDVRAVAMGRALPRDQAFLAGLKAQVAAEGLSDRILFPDEVPVWDMPDWYRALDLYIAPQRWEGFGLTPLEAMACGVPVVASDVGAFRELVAEGVTGHVVPAGAALPLQQAAEALLADPARLDRCRAAARAHVERHFDIRAEAEALAAVYRLLLAEGGS